MPERVGVEIRMQTQTFTILPSDETAIIGKNSSIAINSPNETSDTSKISTASMPSVCTFEPELSGGSELYFVFNSVTVTGWIRLCLVFWLSSETIELIPGSELWVVTVDSLLIIPSECKLNDCSEKLPWRLRLSGAFIGKNKFTLIAHAHHHENYFLAFLHNLAWLSLWSESTSLLHSAQITRWR